MGLRIVKNSLTRKKRAQDYFSVDLIPDPFMVLQHNGDIFNLNISCARLLGSKKEALIGKNFRDFDEFVKLRRKIDQSIFSGKEDTERLSLAEKSFEVYILPFGSEGTSLVRIIMKDITNFLRLETELLKRNKELIVINNLSSAFISSDNLDHAMEDLTDKVLMVTDFHTGWLMLKEDDNFILKTSRGISAELGTKIAHSALSSFCSDTIRLGEPLYVVEASDMLKIPCLHEEGIVFLVVVPLVNEQQPVGMFFLASRVGRDFDFDTASLLTLMGNHMTLIIDKIRLFQETRRLAITDGLTGLYNSRYFYKTLDFEVARTNRYSNPFSLMLFDIDNFKLLNDTYGHQAGDEVLQELAKILESSSRETDSVIRYGGEEFIIILPNTTEEETISLANRIRTAVQEKTFSVNVREKTNITLSCGIASYPKNAVNSKALMNAADIALYAAKAAGKNVVHCFEGVKT